jgi:hypothetical protein
MADEEAPIGGNQVTIEKDAIDPRLVKAGVERVTFFRASPSTVTNPLLAKVLVPAANVGKDGDGFITTANAGNGKIIVFGQSLWWSWVSSQNDPHGGNAKLLRWVLTGANDRSRRSRGPQQPLSTARLATCWAGLAADDVDEAAETRHWLTRAPGADRQTVPFLKARLRPDPPADVNRLERLVAQLEDESFQTREKAQRELEDVGDLASGILKKTLAARPSPELRRRIERILDRSKAASPEKRQCLRAIDVLEQLASPDAKDLLRTLSEGAPGTRITVAAREALDRLASAAKANPEPGTAPDNRH